MGARRASPELLGTFDGPAEASKTKLSFVSPDQPGNEWGPQQRGEQGREALRGGVTPMLWPKASAHPGLDRFSPLLSLFCDPLNRSQAGLSELVSALVLSPSLLPPKWKQISQPVLSTVHSPKKSIRPTRRRFKKKAMQPPNIILLLFILHLQWKVISLKGKGV